MTRARWDRCWCVEFLGGKGSPAPRLLCVAEGLVGSADILRSGGASHCVPCTRARVHNWKSASHEGLACADWKVPDDKP